MPGQILGLIPARGGSKGVPGKNTRHLGGRPLIEYTIEAARLSNVVDRLVVSTDSEAIADIIEESEGDLTDQIIENVVEEAKENDESNNILTDAIEEVMEENPNQVIDIIENNDEINEIIDSKSNQE